MSKTKQEDFRKRMNIEHWKEESNNQVDAKQREEYHEEYSGQIGMSKDSRIFLKGNGR